jgi:hypothetical protein
MACAVPPLGVALYKKYPGILPVVAVEVAIAFKTPVPIAALYCCVVEAGVQTAAVAACAIVKLVGPELDPAIPDDPA